MSPLPFFPCSLNPCLMLWIARTSAWLGRAGRTGSTKWCEEGDGTYCALYRWPSGKGEVESGGSWLGGWRGGYVMPRAARPLLLSVTLSTGTLSHSLFLFSSVSLHTLNQSLSPSSFLFLHAFLSLLSSACRDTH